MPGPLRQFTGFPPTDTTGDNAPSRTFTSDVLAGSLLTMTFVGWGNRTVTSVTDSQGNTWAKAFRTFLSAVAPSTQHVWGELWYCLSASGGPCTVTGAITTVSFAGLAQYVISEWPGTYTFDTFATKQTASAIIHDTATSGTQSAAGLLFALCSLSTSAGGGDAWIPAGFDYQTAATNSVFRPAYRLTTTPETLVRSFSSDPFTIYSAAGIASFIGTSTSDPLGTVVTDNAEVCCSTGDNGNVVPTGGGQGNGAQPVMYPAIGAQIECAGGGVVPTQADITFAETWWHA